jgi:hypothetical protein
MKYENAVRHHVTCGVFSLLRRFLEEAMRIRDDIALDYSIVKLADGSVHKTQPSVSTVFPGGGTNVIRSGRSLNRYEPGLEKPPHVYNALPVCATCYGERHFVYTL